MAPPLLRIDSSDPRPIWRQIEEGITQAIVLGQFATGEAVPSVRDLAKQLRVNPNTVVKAYQRLADQGVLEVRRGEGTFVSSAPPRLSAKERRAALASASQKLVQRALADGCSANEIRDAVEKALDDTPPNRERR